MATPLNKLNEVITRLLQAQAFTAAIGSVSSDAVWSSAAPKILNGNTIKIIPGPATNQINLKASAIVMTVPLAGLVKIEVASDTAINTSVSIPGGARNDVTNYFFSQFTTWNETPVLLANKFNHVYIVYDVSKANNMAIGVISNASLSDPSPTLYSNLGISVSARQAVCYVNAAGKVTLLKTFPSIFGTAASVNSDAATSFADWAGIVTAIETNAIYVQFTFPAGTGTGSVGQLAVKLGADIVGFLPVSPQLLKDADVPVVLKWTLMVGEPGAFI